jgi:tetratricopeptide (TPR) repeat protein
MARRLDDRAGTAFAMNLLGTAQLHQGNLEGAHDTLEEALDLHRRLDDKRQLARVLGHLGGVEEELGRFDRAEQLIKESRAILEDIGDVTRPRPRARTSPTCSWSQAASTRRASWPAAWSTPS